MDVKVDMSDYPTLTWHVDTHKSKGTGLLHFTVTVASSIMSINWL